MVLVKDLRIGDYFALNDKTTKFEKVEHIERKPDMCLHHVHINSTGCYEANLPVILKEF